MATTAVARKTIKLDSDEAGHTGTIAGAMIIQNGTAGSFEVEVGAADTLTMSGTIGNYANGGAGITKTGDGTLILSGTNTYKGATTVNAGVLKLSGGSAIDDIRDVVVGIDGTLDLNDSNETINRLTGSGTVDNTAAGTATLIVGSNGNDATFDGTITDTGAALKFRKTGSGNADLDRCQHLSRWYRHLRGNHRCQRFCSARHGTDLYGGHRRRHSNPRHRCRRV